MVLDFGTNSRFPIRLYQRALSRVISSQQIFESDQYYFENNLSTGEM